MSFKTADHSFSIIWSISFCVILLLLLEEVSFSKLIDNKALFNDGLFDDDDDAEVADDGVDDCGFTKFGDVGAEPDRAVGGISETALPGILCLLTKMELRLVAVVAVVDCFGLNMSPVCVEGGSVKSNILDTMLAGSELRRRNV